MSEHSSIQNKQSRIVKRMILMFIFFSNFQIFNCDSLCKGKSFSDTSCFSQIISFKDKKYRAGHAAINRNGDLIIEYSVDEEVGDRLFFGLKKNGRYYFGDNLPTNKIVISNPDGFVPRYESRNIFVSLKNDESQEFLFSTSSFKSVTELHDFNTNTYKAINSDTFAGNEIFSYAYDLIELKIDNENIYYLFYTYGEPDGDFNTYYIKKFAFISFSFTDYETLATITSSNTKNRILSGFSINQLILVFFYIISNIRSIFMMQI